MNIDFPEESDSSDEDYVPTGPAGGGEVPSEVDSDGDPEDPLSESEEAGKRGTKRRKKPTKTKKKTKTQDTSSESTESSPVKQELSAEEKKKRADSLWADFKKDTGFKKKAAETTEITSKAVANEEVKNKPPVLTNKQAEKVKITQIFEFAGEEVKIEKEVSKDSAEARLITDASGSSAPKGRGRGGLGGIGSVLNQIGKKQKLSTLEKTKLDWNKFKREEKIEEELENYKKGKDGYLERQDFLQRADVRRFEIERDIRNIERNKRLNNVQ